MANLLTILQEQKLLNYFNNTTFKKKIFYTFNLYLCTTAIVHQVVLILILL